MEKRFDINKDGYSIRCRLIFSDHEKTARTFSRIVQIGRAHV